ncbi:N-acetyl-gamma-glutamyl-phosphate reductase [Corynebacterium mustelae]|uniref:N-acetyl-gamma-glutamyl-phosphate reductase n=1 Tax=Corynebacterium mustelae TaxID=571915 RepID=A0A0G3GZ94_9CORY|nr:N-acetyl-gamma-glutamyl-phosphate reductase [Corynebacterium mustelae]AKK05845.1 N-acetyl-gamma-glutamyl-phosphate reductase [Corynebacterium mustelae]
MSIKVAVAGASGYAGGEILRLLLTHPLYQSGEIEIGCLAGASTAGESVARLMPHLVDLAGREIEPTDPKVLAGHDVVFLGLPHGHSAEIAKQLPPEVLVIDCAADFRLRNEQDWVKFYGSSYSGSWPYGIPELPGNREVLAKSKRIAVPGCFPTGATFAMLPAIVNDLVLPDLNFVSITGVSGGGKKASVGLLGSETMGSLKAYNTAGKHRHNPEIKQNLQAFCDSEVSVSFTPVLAPLPRGILTTASAPLKAPLTSHEARNIYNEFYRSEPFVYLVPDGEQPQTQNVLGSNMCHLQVEVDHAANKLLVTTAIDNLTKGTAGAAVQCMNIALGFEETAGLPRNAVAP